MADHDDTSTGCEDLGTITTPMGATDKELPDIREVIRDEEEVKKWEAAYGLPTIDAGEE